MVSQPIDLGWMAVCCHVTIYITFISASWNKIRLQVLGKSCIIPFAFNSHIFWLGKNKVTENPRLFGSALKLPVGWGGGGPTHYHVNLQLMLRFSWAVTTFCIHSSLCVLLSVHEPINPMCLGRACAWIHIYFRLTVNRKLNRNF